MDNEARCKYIATRLQEMLQIANFDDLFEHANVTATKLGYKYWHCAPTAPIVPNINNLGVGNFPPSFWERYLASDLKSGDQTLIYSNKVNRPFTIQEQKKLQDTTLNEAWEVAKMVGVNDVLVIPIHGLNGYSGIVVWANGETVQISPHETKMMNLYSIGLHDSLEDFLGENFRYYEKNISISDRAREVMEWVAQGKSNFEIGVILGLSENTIKFHIKKVCADLGVTSRVQAALKCLYSY